MSKNGSQSEFVREAIREKATRELAALNQRGEAFRGIERARDALHTISSELTTSAGAVTAVAPDAAVAGKLKKLRKAVEDAHALATEIADAIGVDAEREALTASRHSILEALKSVGIDPTTVLSPGGDAQ
jgi:hypothetical protein